MVWPGWFDVVYELVWYVDDGLGLADGGNVKKFMPERKLILGWGGGGGGVE